jgi:hypothetical protein
MLGYSVCWDKSQSCLIRCHKNSYTYAHTHICSSQMRCILLTCNHMCAYMYVCICMYVELFFTRHRSKCPCMHYLKHIHEHTYTHMLFIVIHGMTSSNISIHVHVYMYMHVPVHMYLYIFLVYAYVYVCVYAHIYVCTYIYVKHTHINALFSNIKIYC